MWADHAKDGAGVARVGRRAVLGLGLAGASAARAPLARSNAPARRVVALDWGLAATLLELGVTPVGVPQTALYRRWVARPALPPGVVDVGLRLQPNPEVLRWLRPDLIVAIDEHEPARPVLERIAPVLSLPIYTPERDPLARAVAAARTLADRCGRPAAAVALEARCDRLLAETAAALAIRHGEPVHLLDLLDARRVRVFGDASLFDAVLGRIGLTNAWTGPTNFWGFTTGGLEILARRPDATALIVTPVPADVALRLDDNRLWTSLDFVREGRLHRLDPVLPFGALPSAMDFARQVADHLGPQARPGVGAETAG